MLSISIFLQSTLFESPISLSKIKILTNIKKRSDFTIEFLQFNFWVCEFRLLECKLAADCVLDELTYLQHLGWLYSNLWLYVFRTVTGLLFGLSATKQNHATTTLISEKIILFGRQTVPSSGFDPSAASLGYKMLMLLGVLTELFGERIRFCLYKRKV